MTATTILEMRGVSKAFGHVQALSGVDLELRSGEVLGIVGDNGAGKSTLMKILAGFHAPDSGSILIDGKRVEIRNIEGARKLGIEMVYQDLALFDPEDLVANIFAGRELRRWVPWQLAHRAMRQEAEKIVARIGITARPGHPVSDLSGGQRQMIAIARSVAFSQRERILIMDEPTASLGVTEAAAVDELIRRFGDDGVSILYISHRIPQLLTHADRIQIMKGGRCVGVRDAHRTSVEEIVNLIVAGQPQSGT